MHLPDSRYIEQRDGSLFVSGSRVSIESVILEFQLGHSPGAIASSFPTLELSQVYGVIAYYLENEKQLKHYLDESERKRITEPKLSESNPSLFERLNPVEKQT